jgi:hypothetical protein
VLDTSGILPRGIGETARVTVLPPPTGDAGAPRLSVAFCPSPPLLLPAVAGRAAAETAGLRQACAEALAAVLGSGPETVVVVGEAEPGARFGAGDTGTLRGFGVDLDVPFAGPERSGRARLPLPHTVGAWLLDEAGWTGPRTGVAADDLVDVVGGLTGAVAVLAVGDGSARRSLKAPGHLDPAAEPFDAMVAAALRDGDAAALAALDPAEGERLLAAGVSAWRAVGRLVGDRQVRATLRYDGAPFGVGYLVADWAVV